MLCHILQGEVYSSFSGDGRIIGMPHKKWKNQISEPFSGS